MSANDTNWPAWVRKADEDLLNIRNNLAAERVPWSTVCFHAQQAAEKMLKALLVLHGVQPRKTHDLYALLADCAAFDQTIVELHESCRAMDPFSVDVRYPDPLAEPDESEARAALRAADHVYTAILRRLPPPESDRRNAPPSSDEP